MKRMHVHVAVENLEKSIGFYSALFDAEPAIVKTDYAKWMLDDPRVNFAISTRGREPGSIISASRSKTGQSCMKSMPGSAGPAVPSSSRAKQPAAMRNQKNPGSTIRPASPGRLFIRPGKARITAMVPANERHGWPTPKPAVHRWNWRRRLPRPRAARDAASTKGTSRTRRTKLARAARNVIVMAPSKFPICSVRPLGFRW